MKGLGSIALICSDPIHLFLFESGAGEAEAMTSIAVLSNYIKENTLLWVSSLLYSSLTISQMSFVGTSQIYIQHSQAMNHGQYY